MSAGYSVSLMTSWSGPTVTRWWIKTRLGDEDRQARPPAHLGVVLAAQPSARVTPESLQRLNPFGAAGAWFERLPHFRPDVEPGPAGHLQSEYIEDMPPPLGARPHWGKIMHARAGRLAPLYPKLPAFATSAGLVTPTENFAMHFSTSMCSGEAGPPSFSTRECAGASTRSDRPTPLAFALSTDSVKHRTKAARGGHQIDCFGLRVIPRRWFRHRREAPVDATPAAWYLTASARAPHCGSTLPRARPRSTARSR
jgi:hypothetical protein